MGSNRGRSGSKTGLSCGPFSRCFLRMTENHPEFFSRSALRCLRDVRVSLGRTALGVAKQFADGEQWNSGGNQVRRVRMAQVVDVNVRQTRQLANLSPMNL